MNKNKMVSVAAVKMSAIVLAILTGIIACSGPQSGPDKTLGGAVLGAGWGAGAGAVVGHQVGSTGGGVAVGSGLGLAMGALTGGVMDQVESVQVDHEKQLASLKIQNLTNERQLESIQRTLDNAIASHALGGVYQVFFDADATNLKSGAIADLEIIADNLKASPSASIVNVVGHSDDAGTPEYNAKLAEARARAVSSYIAARGISVDQIRVQSFGSERPIASNTTPVGQQLNRRVDVYIGR